MKKKLIIFPFMLIFYLILIYHDTELFQNALKFLFNPDKSVALPEFIQDYRMIIIGTLFLILVFSYKSIWISCKLLIKTYKECPENPRKPALSVHHLTYLYSPDKGRSFLVWIIELCQQGILSLHFKKGDFHPWSIKREKNENKLSPFDQQLVSSLFEENDTLPLMPSLSNPNPIVEIVASKLYKHIKSETAHFSLPKKSSLPAWFLYFILIFEIPFYNALYPNNPGMIIFVLFSTIFFAAPFYVFARQLPALVTGSILSRIMLAGIVIFALIPQFFIFDKPDLSYFSTAFVPGLTAGLIVLIYNFPLSLKDNLLLSQIIGYKKYLSKDTSPFGENDILWTLGLDIHSDLIGETFRYKETKTPHWFKSQKEDVQFLMKMLHQTFYQSINKTIFGEMKSGSSLYGSRDLGR